MFFLWQRASFFIQPLKVLSNILFLFYFFCFIVIYLLYIKLLFHYNYKIINLCLRQKLSPYLVIFAIRTQSRKQSTACKISLVSCRRWWWTMRPATSSRPPSGSRRMRSRLLSTLSCWGRLMWRLKLASDLLRLSKVVKLWVLSTWNFK